MSSFVPRNTTMSLAMKDELSRLPHPALASVFETYHGYCAEDTPLVSRNEMPFRSVAVVFGFGDDIAISSTGRTEDLEGGFGAFVAGLRTRPALVSSRGTQAGVQVNLSPVAAYRFLGVPMDECANRFVRLSDILGPSAREVIERLRDAPDWEMRFSILDSLFLRALAQNEPASGAIEWSWRRLQRGAPEAPAVGELPGRIGWSQRRFIQRFREQVGLTPKQAARVVRFDGMVRSVTEDPQPSWSRIAAEHGYYDQSHLCLEVREFAECTPTELWRRRRSVAGQ
jgi:AraC-like DNA-binding protein